MRVLMVGVIFIQLHFVQGFQKCIILGVLCEKCPSRTSPYLEDVLDLLEVPEVPDGDPDGWGHHHSTGFCPRFPKMYDTWGVK